MERQYLNQTKNAIAPPQPESAIARSSTHPIEELQGAIGNRAVNQLLANQPTLQAKPMFRGLSRELVIQPKLTIGAVGDKYEQEADRISKQVVNQINTPESRSSTQSQPIQRQEMPEEDDELQMKPVVQRLASKDGGAIAPELEASIQQARGSGHPLADSVREPMERAFGADFSGVRIHADTASDRLNQSIQAKAFTTGQDVFFRQEDYNPVSRGGQELIAHELTHVVQQNGRANGTSKDKSVYLHAPSTSIQLTRGVVTKGNQTTVSPKLDVGDEVEILKTIGMFYQVSRIRDDKKVWIDKKLIKLIKEAEGIVEKNTEVTEANQASKLLDQHQAPASKTNQYLDKQEKQPLITNFDQGEIKEESKESAVGNLSFSDKSETEVQVTLPPLKKDKYSSSKEENIEEFNLIQGATLRGMSDINAKKYINTEKGWRSPNTLNIIWGPFKQWLKENKNLSVQQIKTERELSNYFDEYYKSTSKLVEKSDSKQEEIDYDKEPQEVAKEVALMLRTEQHELAFKTMRKALGQWKQEQRNIFMKNLSPDYHKLAFAAAIGESTGLASLSWNPPLNIKADSQLTDENLKQWHYKKNPEEYQREEALKRDRQLLKISTPAKQMYAWLYEDGPEPKKLNCWETVLLAAYRVNKIDKEKIKKLIYTKPAHGENASAPTELRKYVMSKGKSYSRLMQSEIKEEKYTKLFTGNYDQYDTQIPQLLASFNLIRISEDEIKEKVIPSLKPGDIIMFGHYGEHFAISVGGENLIENDSIQGQSNVRYGTIYETMKRKFISYSYIIWWVSPDGLFNSQKM